MILDLHAHSIKSDDGRAKVSNYVQWIKTRGLPIDGFVLTEHRQFDFESDYSDMARESGLVILKGSEVETEYGHVLVFGVTESLTQSLDFTNIRLALKDVLKAADDHGAIAIPCHPGRPRVGMAAHIETYGIPAGVGIVETFNGGSRENEDEIAQVMASAQGYRGIGGSDAHIVSHIGRCATRFEDSIRNETELVSSLRSGRFEAITYRNAAA